MCRINPSHLVCTPLHDQLADLIKKKRPLCWHAAAGICLPGIIKSHLAIASAPAAAVVSETFVTEGMSGIKQCCSCIVHTPLLLTCLFNPCEVVHALHATAVQHLQLPIGYNGALLHHLSSCIISRLPGPLVEQAYEHIQHSHVGQLVTHLLHNLKRTSTCAGTAHSTAQHGAAPVGYACHLQGCTAGTCIEAI